MKKATELMLEKTIFFDIKKQTPDLKTKNKKIENGNYYIELRKSHTKKNI